MKKPASLKWVKGCIWLYFILLIFEGALRKWVFPSLATPLLIIRDPVALIALTIAFYNNFVKINFYVFLISLITFFSSIFTLLTGHGDAVVTLFGARIFLIHFPFIFVIGKVFDRDDVIKMGKAIIVLSLPMTILLAAQFYSPQSAWVNRGVGGDMEGSGFSGAMGYFRSSGTFSFTNGLVIFYALVIPFILFFWLDSKAYIKKWLLQMGTICCIIAIPLSISRTLFFSSVITLLFAALILTRQPKLLWRMISAFIILAVGFYLLSGFSFMQTGIMAFAERFDSANKTEGGLEGIFLDRFLGGMIGAIEQSNNYPFFGLGLGMGTNVGAKLMTGKVTYLISEGEWGRLIGEMGILFGIAVILIRSHLSISLLRKAYRAISKKNILPWLLISYGFINIIQGLWAQPTALGFIMLCTGLIMAAFRRRLV
ncbi:MAG: hypothetical protein ACK41O_08950 [Runella zeae]